MRIGAQLPNFVENAKELSISSIGKILGWMYQFLQSIAQIVDGGGLGFGDGTFTDNIKGSWIAYTTNATPDTEDIVNHNIGMIPVGWITMSVSKAGVLYKGTTAWTSTSMSLKCNVASVVVLIFVVGPSNQAY